MKVKDLIAQLQMLPPEGVVINPYWDGERTPLGGIYFIATDAEHDCYDFEREISPVGVVRLL